ncbi:MAG: electron transfer flavoprotein subunit beta/FixA family protein [Pseudomonadota bacterium]
MKIGVLVKQVPDTETKIKISSDQKNIDEAGIKWVINPYDEIAVEQALKLKEQVGGEVIIISAGPARAQEAIRQALAMGADSGIHINTQNDILDVFATANILTAAIKTSQFEIIFTGKQAVDDDNAQVHIAVAEKLGWPHISPVEKFSFKENSVEVQRPVSGGTKEIISVPLPVVIGCEKGLNEPRYPSLPGIMKAKSKPLEELKATDLLENPAKKLNILSYSLPPERTAGKIIEGEPEQAAAELVRLLREEAKVI